MKDYVTKKAERVAKSIIRISPKKVDKPTYEKIVDLLKADFTEQFKIKYPTP